MEISVSVRSYVGTNMEFPGCEYSARVLVHENRDGHRELTHYGGQHGSRPVLALNALLLSVQKAEGVRNGVRRAVINAIRAEIMQQKATVA